MIKGYVHLIKADYNEETGISTATIDTDLGAFEGRAKLHDEDRDFASKYTGCRYAETRATIKYLKMKKKFILSNIKGVKTILSDLHKDTYHYHIEVKAVKYLNQLLEKYETNLTEIDDAIKFSQESLFNDIEQRPALIKRIYKNKEDK